MGRLMRKAEKKIDRALVFFFMLFVETPIRIIKFLIKLFILLFCLAMVYIIIMLGIELAQRHVNEYIEKNTPAETVGEPGFFEKTGIVINGLKLQFMGEEETEDE